MLPLLAADWQRAPIRFLTKAQGSPRSNELTGDSRDTPLISALLVSGGPDNPPPPHFGGGKPMLGLGTSVSAFGGLSQEVRHPFLVM